MNFSQKFGLLILILISIIYVYSSFFGQGINLSKFKKDATPPVYSPLDNQIEKQTPPTEKKTNKTVKIYILDKTGNLRSVDRLCGESIKSSCFEFAINELLKSPSKDEKAKGFTSEIPQSTKLLSIRESSNSIMIDLSSDFETGGGAESTYMRIKQVIKTVNSNTSIPTYLYINGTQANVIGGEGVMLKQPLNERSLDE